MVPWNGTYWLFTTDTQGGYWRSGDLVSWSLVAAPSLPPSPVAPDAFVVNGTIYFTCIGCAFFSTSDPASGVWKNLGGAGHYPDPMVLVDDNRWFMYSGCSPATPGDMKTTELDPHNGFKPIGSPTAGVVPDPATRGFEVPGDFNNLTANKPYIEGSWVTKRNGVYYWQYAAPGTQYKTYSDGIFTSTSPAGPFTYAAQYSPVCHKPTGFLGGAGHSSTFDDFAGQTWHISTASIDVRDATCGHFERRAALHPVRWGEHDGEMAVDTILGDYPQYASGAGSPGWMLLSYVERKPLIEHIHFAPFQLWTFLTGAFPTGTTSQRAHPPRCPGTRRRSASMRTSGLGGRPTAATRASLSRSTSRRQERRPTHRATFMRFRRTLRTKTPITMAFWPRLTGTRWQCRPMAGPGRQCLPEGHRHHHRRQRRLWLRQRFLHCLWRAAAAKP